MKSYLIPLNNTNLATQDLDLFATIGRDSHCSNPLNCEDLSERQFSIFFRQGHHWIRDLRSGTPTLVNESSVKETPLAEGDIIRVQNTEFRFTKFPPAACLELKSANETWAQELVRIGHASNTEFPILILGPSGAGKDVLSQAIHNASARKNGPCVSVNCSSLTESLVESELFGHVKGSFTGAISDRKGAFEAARNGTLFLDEIGDLPLSMQAKLLRALENNEIRPVGSDQTIKTNVRIIAATHQNLLEKIREGQFRADLYYRLNVVSIQHPALNERMEDFDSLLMNFAKEYRVRFSIECINELKCHTWPGNIRELKNFVARCSALFPGLKIETSMLHKLIDPIEQKSAMPSHILQLQSESNVPMPLLKDIEKQMIIKRLIANRGNQRRTAYDLGLPKSTLHDRLKYFEINPKEFKI